jgi:hypothetical protein
VVFCREAASFNRFLKEIKENTMRQYLVTMVLLSNMTVNAATFDVETDFSLSTNPNGVWSYGQYTPGNDPTRFVAFGSKSSSSQGYIGEDVWFAGDYPRVSHNNTVAKINGTVWFYDDAVILHPGREGEEAVVRWTAPNDFNALYLDVAFIGVDYTTTDVHVSLNGAELFAGDIEPLPGTRWGDTERFTPEPFTVSVGDVIDFRVGFLSPYINAGLNNDSTGLQAILSDEPGHSVRSITVPQFNLIGRVPSPGILCPEGSNNCNGLLPVPLPPSLPLMAVALTALWGSSLSNREKVRGVFRTTT